MLQKYTLFGSVRLTVAKLVNQKPDLVSTNEPTKEAEASEFCGTRARM